MVTIIDLGMGNLGSIQNMLKKAGAKATISSEAKELEKAEKLILPGVGAFDYGMKNLKERGLLEVLNDKVICERIPILGLCLGMQLFSKRSEEGQLPGLGWLDAETVRFKFDPSDTRLKIPHMGWNTVQISQEHPLFQDMQGELRFYFVHSYHVLCRDKGVELGRTTYGYEFTSVVRRENILGTQFHPEKSHRCGMAILRNFVEKL